MSIELLNKALKVQNLSPTKKFILVILCNYADEDGSCYPSYKHIAKICGLGTIKSVRGAIKEFEEKGILRIVHRKKEDGGFTSNRYFINFDPLYPQDTRGHMDYNLVSQRYNNTKKETKTLYTESFNTFWKLYPRKVAKKTAFNIFRRLSEKDIDKILDHLTEHKASFNSLDIKFVPFPSTWLNGERWNDDIKDTGRSIKDYSQLDRSSDWAEGLD